MLRGENDMSDHPLTKHERHAEGGPESSERTLCGLVLLQPEETGCVVALAAPGNVVTCLQCRRIIADSQALYTSNFRRRRAK